MPHKFSAVMQEGRLKLEVSAAPDMKEQMTPFKGPENCVLMIVMSMTSDVEASL